MWSWGKMHNIRWTGMVENETEERFKKMGGKTKLLKWLEIMLGWNCLLKM